jgi:hypothetical protein
MKKPIIVLIFILSLFVVFSGCENSKKGNETPRGNKEIKEIEEIEKIREIPDYDNYNKENKSFEIRSIRNIEALNNFSQEEIEKYIERITITFWYRENNLPNDFNYIERFPNIKGLIIYSCYEDIDNYESLLSLKKIEEMEIKYVKNFDIPTIAKLKTLKSLSLYECDELKDISALGNLNNLEKLEIKDCDNIENINPIFDITSLKELRLYFKKMPNLTQIKKLTNLEYFEASVVIDKNLLDSLTNLKRLKKIKIMYAGVKDVSPLFKIPGFMEIECMLDLHEAISNCYDYHRGETEYQKESNSNDAVETVKRLLENGANPNERKQGHLLYLNDSYSSFELEGEITPLTQSRVPGVTELLIKYGARVNDQDKYGRTALMVSAFFDDKDDDNLNMKVLLKNGADVNFRKNTGQTALYLAAMNNNIASVKILLNNGADINLRDNQGVSPLMAAKIFIYSEDYEEMEKVLKKAGAKMNDADIKTVNKIIDDGGNYGEIYRRMGEILSMEVNIPGDH